MIEEFVEGEYYFRVSEEGRAELEALVAKKLEKVGIKYVELVKEENQYTRFVTGVYHIRANCEVVEELVKAGCINGVERVPKVQAGEQPPP